MARGTRYVSARLTNALTVPTAVVFLHGGRAPPGGGAATTAGPRAAQALDPLEVVLSWDIATDLYFANRDDAALRELEKATEIFPNIPLLPYWLAMVLFQKGAITSAPRVVEAFQARPPDHRHTPGCLSGSVASALARG